MKINKVENRWRNGKEYVKKVEVVIWVNVNECLSRVRLESV